MKDKQLTAAFVGTFNPFTIGHLSIARRALALVDQLYIGVGINPQKANNANQEDIAQNIRHIFEGNPNVKVETYSGLTVDFCKKVGATVIVKGVRSALDFEYERTQADINRQIEGIDTMLLISEPQYAHISSTMVRELMNYGKDVSQFLP